MKAKSTAAIEPAGSSRRRALALMLGASSRLFAAPAAGNSDPPLRLAISESLVTDVNVNDARAAMLIWFKTMTQHWNIAIEFNPNVFDTAPEILNRIREGRVDAVALNIVEYRQAADCFDGSQVVAEADAAALEQYVILVKQNSGIRQVGDLRGRRLITLKSPKMCVASAWLSTLLHEGRHVRSEQFFGSVISESKFSRVVLPVFFGQVESCLTSKRGFDTMCELNPQVGRDLRLLASSPRMVVTFYIFRKNYQSAHRDRLVKVLSGLRTTQAGQQLATFFQFQDLVIKDAGCLAPALGVLEMAERARRLAGSREPKG